MQLDDDDNNNNGNAPQKMTPSPRGKVSLVFFLVLLALTAWFAFSGNTRTKNVMPYSTFVSYVQENKVSSVKIVDQLTIEVKVLASNGELQDFKTTIPYVDLSLLQLLRDHNVKVEGAISGASPWQIIFDLVPWLFLIFIIWMFYKQFQGNNKAFTFGKSKAKLYMDNGNKITFKDVAGQKEAKYELNEVVDYLKNPQKFVKMGARIPKGVLLVGLPGTGKTLLAKAVAGEAGVPFFHMSGSDFVEMFVGVGASRVRDLFEQGRKNAPCIIFIDELDAVGRTRGAGLGGGHDEREQTLNQMLVEMDGFGTKDGIIILAATNRPDVLDPALLRPGRFDRQVVVAMPDIKEREDILKIHMAKVPMSTEVNVEKLARATPGMSGADLANMVNEAVLFTIRRGKTKVEMQDLEEARDKVLMGIARTSMAISEEDKRATAFHESGHALLHYYVQHADPLHKVTIIPRGRALGVAFSLPEKDTYSRNKEQILDQIVITFGGYAAEEIIYSQTSTGTSNDIKQATALARKMVCEWGMAEEVGPVAYGQEDEPIFLGKELARHKDYSEDTAMHIDKAITRILTDAKNRALSILSEHKDQLVALTEELIRKETLLDEEIRVMFDFGAKPQVS